MQKGDVSEESPKLRTALVYCEKMTQYDMGPTHPLKPERLRLTKELISAYGLLGSNLVSPQPASLDDVLTVHVPDFVEMVRKLSEGKEDRNAWRYGFDYLDNRPFLGMYEAALLYTGASITAAEMIIEGKADRVFSISGGLHHAMPDRASGFCVFNDPAIAIYRLLRKFHRVAYIDIDAHHGDGVQAIFYKTNKVLTVSMHESGQFLFPGSGYPNEIGEGEGTGFSVNIPLAPYSGDDIMVSAFDQVVPPLMEAYKPQVIVAQLGVDAHFLDPLAHLQLTSRGFVRLVEKILGFGTPVLALGGGGYNVQTVARLWTLAFALMDNKQVSDVVPEEFARRYGIHRLHDTQEPRMNEEKALSIQRAMEETVQVIEQLVFPHHGLRTK